jgi:hypothetical protein
MRGGRGLVNLQTRRRSHGMVQFAFEDRVVPCAPHCDFYAGILALRSCCLLNRNADSHLTALSPFDGRIEAEALHV